MCTVSGYADDKTTRYWSSLAVYRIWYGRTLLPPTTTQRYVFGTATTTESVTISVPRHGFDRRWQPASGC